MWYNAVIQRTTGSVRYAGHPQNDSGCYRIHPIYGVQGVGGRISEETTAIIRRAANEMGYYSQNRQNQFDGIIALEPVPWETVEDIPVMEMCSKFPEQEHPRLYSFLLDFDIRQAVEHLAALGHQEIGFIVEKNTTAKLDAFRDTMLQLDIPLADSHIYTSAYRFERIGHDGIRAFHIRGSMPTGILCAYDEVAFGAIEELEKFGYRVPEDVSVIGINNVDYCAYCKPPLTTMQGNIDTMVEKMVEVIQAVLLEEKPCPHRHTITSTLVVRKSTAPRAAIQNIGGKTI